MYLFTVLLILPDYIGNYGSEFYTAHVAADTPAEAIMMGRKEAMENIIDEVEKPLIDEPEDLGLVYVFHGFQVPIDHAQGLH